MAGWDPNSRPVFSSWVRMRDEDKQEVDWQKVLRAYGRVRMPYATGPTSTLPEDLQDEAAKQQRAKDAAEASGIGDTIKRGGVGALGVVGGVFDMGRQLVVGTGAGVFNSVVAPGLDALYKPSTKSWRTDITGDGIVNSNDTLAGQLTAAINPFDDRQVAGMGILAPFLNVEDDDRLSTRMLKYTGALAGDIATDPTIVVGVAGKGVAAANKAAKAGLEATEIATAKLGTEISEDAARSYVAKHLAKQGSDQVIDAARRYGVEATEDGFRAVGRTADDAAQSLADNMSEDTLRKAFGDAIGVEAYSAYRRGGNIPLRRSLESQFGDDVGRSIFNSFSPEVAGKFAAEIPFTKFRTTATGVTGGGQVLERFGAAGRLVEDALVAKHRGLDRFIGKIPAGSNRALNRAARIAGVEAAGELDATVKQIDVGRYVMAQEASRKAAMEAQGQVRKAFESSQVLINGLRDESGDAVGFDDAVRRFNQVTDLNTIDTEALSIVEANALEATRGIRNAQSLYRDMREKYGHLRQFENVGIIEGERRVITEEGLKFLEDIGNGAVKMQGTGRFKSRDAFYEMDQITGEKVWISTGEINDDLGFKFFEDDVFKAHTIYMKRLETVAGTVAHEDVLRRAGVVSRLASESTAGTVAEAATRAAATIERQDADLEERLADTFPGAAKDAARVADSDLSVAQRVAKESYQENKARAMEQLLGEQAPELAARRASVEAARERLWDAATREVQEAAVEREVLDELRALERELKEALKISREESRRLRKEDLVAAKAEIETKKSAVIEVEAEAKRLSDELEETRQRLADLERSRKTLRQKDRRARKAAAEEATDKDIRKAERAAKKAAKSVDDPRTNTSIPLKGGSTEEYLDDVRQTLQRAVDSESPADESVWQILNLFDDMVRLDNEYRVMGPSYWEEVSNELQIIAQGGFPQSSNHLIDFQGRVRSLDDVLRDMRSYAEDVAPNDEDAAALLANLDYTLKSPQSLDAGRLTANETAIADNFGYDELRKLNLDNQEGMDLLGNMAEGWTGEFDDLIDAVEALGNPVRYTPPARTASFEPGDVTPRTYRDMAQTDDGIAADKLGRNIRQLRKVEKVKMETDVINGARVQAAKDELGMAEVRRDLLRDKNFKTEYDAAADDIEKEIWQVKAEIVRIGTKTDIDQLEKMAIAGLKKTFKKEELDPLARLESSQKQARKDLRSGVTPVEGQGVAESIADRRSLVKELSEDLYGYNEQRKSIAESILGDAGVTSGEKLDEVLKQIDDAPLTTSAREIIDGQIAARREEVIFLDDVLSDLSNPARQLRAVLDAAATTRGQDGSWIKSMEATILAIQEAMTAQQGRFKQLISIDAQRARAQKLTLDAADEKALDKVRIRIQERINELGVYGSMNDDETRRLFERLLEIQERMAIRIAKESDSINYRDYASVLEEQTNVALKSREMKEVAEVVARDRREIERLAAMTEDAFSLETSDAFANERLRAQLVTGKAERLGSFKIKGQVVTVPEYMRDWIVSPAIAEAMARQHRILTNPNATIGGWRMALHALESDWKMMATVMRGPSFVIRNAFGGIYNAMLGGTAGGDFAMGFRYQKALDKAMDNANKAAFGSVSGERMTSNNMLTYLDDFIKKELDYEVLPGVKMFDLHKQMEARGIFGSGYMSVIDSDDPYSRLVTEFGKGFRNSASGVNRADLNLSERVLYQASDKLANNRYTRSMGSFQDRTERFLRSSQYIAGIRRSGDTEAGHLWADSMVRMTQFDYSDLSDFEKRYLKHVFPFFTFTRNNLPLQVRSFVMRPGVPMTVLRMNNYANEYFGSQNEELNGFLNENMPDWLREAGAWPSMFGSEDEPIAFGMGAPLIDINRYFDLENFDSVGDVLTTPLRMAGGFAEEGVAQMNPALKIGVEAATGTNVFTGSKYRDTVGSPFMRALLPDKGVDEKTLQPTQSGFAQQTLRNLFPIIGQAERLAPVGPFKSEKYQDRWVTSILGSGIGLSGAPVGPLATMTNDQVAGQAAQNTEEIQKEINKKFAAAGLDYGAIADWRSKNKMVPWAAIAQAIRQGNPRFYSEGARLALGESGALPKNTQKELEELLQLLENAQG